MPRAIICSDCGRTFPEGEAKATRCPSCQPQHAARMKATRKRSDKRTPEGLARRAEHQAIITSPQYRRVRDMVRRRDGVCVSCGTTAGLTVHHVVPAREAPELAFDPSNLVTLCRPCHGRAEAAARRRRQG